MADIIIIGAGTAGLSAAIYCERSGKHAIVFDSLGYGGQIINTPSIQNYPGIKDISGFDFATGLYEQAQNLGAEIKNEEVLEISDSDNEKEKTVKTDSGEYKAAAVIIASGAKNRPLGLDREKELIGSGVSYCATCDGMFFRGKDVAVAGGGNTALEDAAFLANYCRKVYIIHRRDEFRGDKSAQDALKKHENVEYVMNSNVTKLIGEKNLEKIEVTNKISGEKTEIPVSGIFVAIGQAPENERFKNVCDLDKAGYIISDESCTTKTPGIFAAGDCRAKKVRQLTTAAADGAVAALAACAFAD